MMRSIPILVFAWIAASMPPATAQIVAIEYGGTVRIVDPPNGASAVITQTGYYLANSLAQDSTGRLYFVASISPSQLSRVVEFKLDTLSTVDFGAQGLNDVRALAFAPGDDVHLYAVTSLGGGVQNRLHTVNLAQLTGSAQLIGSTSLAGIQGMTFSPAGVLYAWSVSFGLITIDPVTAQATDVNAVNDGTSEIQTLCFGPDGVLYGLYDNLYTLDPLTGAKTLVASGTLGGGIRGAEFVPTATVPRTYCTSLPNSTGLPARIGWAGSTSFTQNEFTLLTNQLPPNTMGRYFAGRLRTDIPFGSGRLCIGGPMTRLSVVPANAAGEAQLPVDLLLTPIQAGARWNFQFWYRNVTVGGAGFNTSDGLEVLFAP